MKKIVLMITVLLFVCGAPAGFSGIIPEVEMEAGLEIGDFHYRESHIMREDGVQGGIYGSIAVLAARPWFFQFYMSLVGGDVEYDGGYYYGGRHYTLKGDTSNFIYNFRGIAGFIVDTGGLSLMPYSGLGYRYLENDLRDLEDPAIPARGYLREQTYFYLPLGLELTVPVSGDGSWTMGLRSEFDWMFAGYNKSGSTELDGQDGWGFRLLPFIRYDVNEQIGLKLEAFGEYWKIDDSDVKDGIYEPENASNYYGARLGLLF